MCCTRLAENIGRKKSPFWHHRTTLSGCIFAAEAYIDNQKENLLNTDTSYTCPHNMVNFGILTAEICWRVWGTPANFNGFRVLAALLHGTLVVGVSQTAALNRGRHLYLTGRPSRWALAHILVGQSKATSIGSVLKAIDKGQHRGRRLLSYLLSTLAIRECVPTTEQARINTVYCYLQTRKYTRLFLGSPAKRQTN